MELHSTLCNVIETTQPENGYKRANHSLHLIIKNFLHSKQTRFLHFVFSPSDLELSFKKRAKPFACKDHPPSAFTNCFFRIKDKSQY